jgi:uncharacterized membrane protein (GlpM family)
MATMLETAEAHRARHVSPLVGWGLVTGGAFFFVGGSMHPKQDPPDVTVTEHLRIMYEDPAWYPSHALWLVGIALIAASLVALVRGRSLIGVRRAHLAAVVAAGASVASTFAMLLHLIAAIDADRIAAHQHTPITNVWLVIETITVPAFGFSIAALALIGATTHTIGNRVAAIFGIVGGVAYGLAGATFLFTDKLDFLFPIASGIAVWAVAAGIGLLGRRRTAGATFARPNRPVETAHLP